MTRYYLDPRTGDWLTKAAWEAKYETPTIYSAVRGGQMPRGLREVPPATAFGKSAKFRHAQVHQLSRVIEGTYEDRPRLAGVYACGQSTVMLAPVTNPADSPLCTKCFTAQTWSVYGYWNAAGDALYVGQTGDLAARRKTHRSASPWYPEAAWHDVLSNHTTPADAIAAERAAIGRLAPLHNVHHNTKQVA